MKREAETVFVEIAAERLGMSVRAVRRAAAEGRLPAIRIGRRWLILKAPLDEILSHKS